MDNSQQNTSWGLPDFATPSLIELPDLCPAPDHGALPSSSSSSSSRSHHTQPSTTTYQPPPPPPLPRYPPSTFALSGQSSSSSPLSSSSTQNIQQRAVRNPSGTLDNSPRPWLEPEPSSPGASTLVETPPAAHMDNASFSRNGTFSSPLGRSGSGSGGSSGAPRPFSPSPSSHSYNHPATIRPANYTTSASATSGAASAFITSTSLSSNQPFNGRSSDDDPSSFVPIQLEPMSSTSKKTGGSSDWGLDDQGHHHLHSHGYTTVVTMHGDMTPASRTSGGGEQSYCAKHGRHDSCASGNSPLNGRYSPSVAGSSASARTLLAGGGGAGAGAGAGGGASSAATGTTRSFLGTLLAVPWQRRRRLSLTSSTATLISPAVGASPPEVSPTGKVYMKRPKTKTFGGSGGAGGSESSKKEKGNGTRMAMFSNERTFLHWIRFGILLGAMSMTLLNFGQLGSLAHLVGTSLLCVAMLALVYATVLFHYRDRLLSYKLSAQTLQMELRKQISAEPGALTAARIADVMGRRTGASAAATDGGAAGPATIINVDQEQTCSKKTKGASRATQARIDKLKRKADKGRYYDRVGPTLLGGALIVAYSFNFYLSIVSPPSNMLTHATGTSFFGQM